MTSLLFARECGYAVDELHEWNHGSWLNPYHDCTRTIPIPWASRLDFIDILRPHGTLMLWGGAGCPTTPPNPSISVPIIGISKYAEPDDAPEFAPLMQASATGIGGDYLTCARWYSQDPFFFVTGSNVGELWLWDTQQAHIVQQYNSIYRIRQFDKSRAPASHDELVAVAYESNCEVAVVNVQQGAVTHRLEGHKVPVQSVVWAPLNPNIMASIDILHNCCLFDIRRSGQDALLVQFDRSRRMPTPFSVYKSEGAAPEEDTVSTFSKLQLKERRVPLGLGCAWDRGVAQNKGQEKQLTRFPYRPRIRFSMDGAHVIEGSLRHLFVWDIFTGRLVNKMITDSSVTGPSIFMGIVLFEVTQDGKHVLTVDLSGRIKLIDWARGLPVYVSKWVIDVGELAYHPRNNEIIYVSKLNSRKIGHIVADSYGQTRLD